MIPLFRSGSLDGGRYRAEEGERRRGGRRRPAMEQDQEQEAEYSMPASSTLYDDAAGLKLFLDILNGPDGQNKEAEAELRKLIDRSAPASAHITPAVASGEGHECLRMEERAGNSCSPRALLLLLLYSHAYLIPVLTATPAGGGQ